AGSSCAAQSQSPPVKRARPGSARARRGPPSAAGPAALPPKSASAGREGVRGAFLPRTRLLRREVFPPRPRAERRYARCVVPRHAAEARPRPRSREVGTLFPTRQTQDRTRVEPPFGSRHGETYLLAPIPAAAKEVPHQV